MTDPRRDSGADSERHAEGLGHPERRVPPGGGLLKFIYLFISGCPGSPWLRTSFFELRCMDLSLQWLLLLWSTG